ncbi:Scr1 family TA system antitoxin-like transcriptional regulator [Streptomyces sp. NPDC058122]|uniref:Scr1 family TA system antitoxin-like transcriptional regulator n=1 Tax=Streptomyces sp. NPDC058122 TaxID=3346349 RepID=UPI0036E7C0F7
MRREAGWNQQELGKTIGYSLEQVASVEQGRRPAKAAFTTAADRVLEARGVLEVLQDEVDRAKLPRFFRNFALIEAEALIRFSYDPLLIPGLLQTETYAQALLEAHFPLWTRRLSNNAYRPDVHVKPCRRASARQHGHVLTAHTGLRPCGTKNGRQGSSTNPRRTASPGFASGR